jgi:hypothetical protein
MASHPNVQGIFIKGGDILRDLDQGEIDVIRNSLQRQYGGTWKFTKRVDGKQALGRDRYEDGYILMFERVRD